MSESKRELLAGLPAVVKKVIRKKRFILRFVGYGHFVEARVRKRYRPDGGSAVWDGTHDKLPHLHYVVEFVTCDTCDIITSYNNKIKKIMTIGL